MTSIRDSKISRGCAKILEIPEGRWGGKFWGPILENPEGRGVIRQILSVGVVWIFSGTTQCDINNSTGSPNSKYMSIGIHLFLMT